MFVVIFSGSVSFSWMHMYVLSCFEDNLSLFHLDSGLMLYLYSSTFCLVLQKNSGRKMLAIIFFEQLMQKWKRSWNLLKASVLMKSTVLYTVPGSSSLFGVAVLKKIGVKLHEIRTLTWRISIFDPLSQFVFTQEKDVNVEYLFWGIWKHLVCDLLSHFVLGVERSRSRYWTQWSRTGSQGIMKVPPDCCRLGM